MKILFHAYNTCCQTESGGVQVRIRKIKRLLENKGFQVDFFNPYTTRLIDYDILHLFMLKEETASLVETARTLGLKIVLSSIVTVYPYNYRHLIKKTLQPFMNYLGFFSRYQNERAILRDVDHIIAETPQEMRYIYSRYDINQSKISVIPNGVDAFVESGNEIYKLLHKNKSSVKYLYSRGYKNLGLSINNQFVPKTNKYIKKKEIPDSLRQYITTLLTDNTVLNN